MPKKLNIVFWKKTFIFLLLIFSFYQSYSLRKIGFNVIPEPSVILDEHTNVWNGLSIRKTGLPTAWSILPAYRVDAKKHGSGGGVEGFNIKVDGKLPGFLNYRSFKSPITSVLEMNVGKGKEHIQIVQPYLDHPPLGGLVLSLGVPKNVKTFIDLSAFDMRRVSLILALITQILLVIFSYQLTKKYLVALLSSFVFATVPSYLLLTRYALLENVLTPVVLMVLIIVVHIRNKYLERIGKKVAKNLKILLLIAGIISGMATLVKLTGWVVFILVIFLLKRWKLKNRTILYFAIPNLLVGSLYFLFSFYLSPRLFLDLFVFQSLTRSFIGSINLLVSSVRVNILHFPFDGWWLGGFLSLLLLPKKEEYLPLYGSIILILISALFMGGANYPWYFIPLIPMLVISVAIFFVQVIRKPDFFKIMFLFFVFVSSSFYWGYGVYFADQLKHNYGQPFFLYRLLFLTFILLAYLSSFWSKFSKFNKIWKIGVFMLLIVLFLLNQRSFYFILEHWGKFPLLYTPGTF